MPKLNTYELKSSVDANLQVLGIIPGNGAEFETVRVSQVALSNFTRAITEETLTSGTANNSNNLGGQAPSYYASAAQVSEIVPDLATLAAQLLGVDSDTASTPEGVKAFVSQFGLAGNALPLADLDAVTAGQQFSYNDVTLNTPAPGTYGAGFAVVIDGSAYQTQVVVENGTQKLYLRNSNGSGFSAWRLADAPNYLAQLPFLDASNPGGSQLVTGTAFTKVPLYSVTTDNRSGWNGGTTEYTIPEDGLYEVIGSIRPVRSGINNLPANEAIAVGVGLASAMADSKNVNWAHAIGTAELGVEVHRLIRFTTGQIVCLFGRHTHTAGVAYVFAGLQIRKVSD